MLLLFTHKLRTATLHSRNLLWIASFMMHQRYLNANIQLFQQIWNPIDDIFSTINKNCQRNKKESRLIVNYSSMKKHKIYVWIYKLKVT